MEVPDLLEGEQASADQRPVRKHMQAPIHAPLRGSSEQLAGFTSPGFSDPSR